MLDYISKVIGLLLHFDSYVYYLVFVSVFYFRETRCIMSDKMYCHFEYFNKEKKKKSPLFPEFFLTSAM